MNPYHYLKITINQRMHYTDRHIVEDEFAVYCAMQGLDVHIMTGGTNFGQEYGEHEPLSYYFEIVHDDGRHMNDKTADEILHFFDVASKGSKIEYINNDTVIKTAHFGELEGLMIVIKLADLPQNQEIDLGEFVWQCDMLMNGVGQFTHHWQGDEICLYFYGKNYDEMLSHIQNFVHHHPFCQNADTVQIA